MILANESAADKNTPVFAVEDAFHIPVNAYPRTMTDIPPSRMFLIKDALKAYKDKMGADATTFDASQGDGGASLPGVPRAILERAAALQIEQGTGYDQPWGTPRFRKAAAEQYWQLQAASGWNGENIAFTQGGRDALIKAYNAMIHLGHGNVGDALVVSRVPWISYNWGPYGVGLNVVQAPGDPDEGWKHTPESIQETAAYVRRAGRDVAGLVITSPDNPTGLTLPVEEQIELAKAAIESGYPFVLFDWIYHWVTDGGPSDINTVLQAFTPADREKLMFVDGITKSLGASNIRSAQLVADKRVIKHVSSQASHGVIPSFYAQAVAIAAYEMGFGEAAAPIINACKESRQVLKSALRQQGWRHVIGDGYYAFIDTEQYCRAAGFEDTEKLLMYLGENYGVVVVPGVYFSDAGRYWVRFSYALPAQTTQGAVDRLAEGLSSLL